MSESQPEANPANAAGTDESSTGLPFLRSWRAVYLFVVTCFVCWVVILAMLPWVFA